MTVTRSAAPELPDAAARALIRGELDRNLIAEAAAGTGKTTELVQRMIAVLARGRSTVDRMVAVTFTEKAAGEIKLRLREGLERARRAAARGSAEHRHLEDALARLEEAWVGTIHGFCAEILRERAVEAGVDPGFRVLAEPEAERLYEEAFRLWFEEQLHDPPEGVRRSLRRPGRGGEEDEDPIGRLRRAGWDLIEWRDFDAPWRRDPFDREGEVAVLVDSLHRVAELSERAARPFDALHQHLAPARALSREIRVAEEARERDLDGLEAGLIGLLETRSGEGGPGRRFGEPRAGGGHVYGFGVTRAEMLEAHQRLCEALEGFRRRADADLAALLQHELAGVAGRYEEHKRRRGALDFVDLLILARDLVRGRADVRAAFQERFTHFFVDEFQDTDPVQAEILMLLASADPRESRWDRVAPTPGKLFVVGDPQQSIYRFRRADVGVYQRVKELLLEHGAECVPLTTSFRSVPAIQELVNAAFAPVMRAEPRAQQAGYVPLAPYRPAEDGERPPGVVALPAPRPFGSYGGVTKTAVAACLPGAVAAFLDWLLHDSGWTVTERDRPEERVAVAARHVCLLFRRLHDAFAGDVTRPYVEELEARGIRHLRVGGRSYHDREEVEAMRTALDAIEWPDDELAVFATLRGPLFAIGDEELLEYRHVHGRLHPFRLARGAAERLQPVVEVLGALAALHRRRNQRPIAETLHALLEETRAHAGFAFHPAGEQALANVLHLAEQARSYELGGGLSFRGFVDQLAAEARSRRVPEAPIIEEGTDGVRLMSVHKAKGLEFPVVVLADVTTPIARGQAGRHSDAERRLCVQRIGGWSPAELLEAQALELERDRAEGVRIAYVAATRARDLLVVPMVGVEAWDGSARGAANWVAPLVPALTPEPVRWGDAQPAPRCPGFGASSVLDDGGKASVRPGLHAIGGAEVVWWDPRALRLEAPPPAGIRRQELISRAAEPAVVEEDRARHFEWKASLEARRERSSRPSVRVETVTARAAAATDEERFARAGDAAVEVIDTRPERDRPAGVRFGSLVHAVLSTVALDGGVAGAAAAAALQGRILGATGAEIEAAARAAGRVLAHPVLDRARRAAERGECRRETPLTLVDEGVVIDGQVDLAFVDDDAWTVVDFKTDRELERGLDVHRRQVRLYAAAVARATLRPARGVLMRV